MTSYNMESFIQWCDDITIAQEGLKDIFSNKTVKAKDARKASSMTDVKKLIKQGSPLIKLEGSLEDECKEKIDKTNLKILAQVVGMVIPWVGLGLFAWLAVETTLGKNAIAKYKMWYGKDKGIYLLRRDVDFDE